MRIGLLSDSHGDTSGLRRALTVLSELDVEAIVHCGDICCLDSLEMLKLLKLPAWLVAGNMDHNLANQLQASARGTTVTFEHNTAEIPLGDNNYLIATHGDNDYLLDELIRGEQFPYICHGHTHRARDVRYGATRVICPGAISAPRHPGFPTATVIDSNTETVDFYNITTGKTVLV